MPSPGSFSSHEGPKSPPHMHEPYGQRPPTPSLAHASSSHSNEPSEVITVDKRAGEEEGGFVGYIARGRRSRLLQEPQLAHDSIVNSMAMDMDDAPPLVVQTRRDVEEEGYTVAQIWRIRYSVISPIYIAFKTAALCTLPLSILAFSDSTKGNFRAGSLLAVVGTSNTKLYLGQQLAGTLLVLQGAVWMVLWGTLIEALSVTQHDAAWWGLAFTGIIFVSFFPNLRSRRLIMSYTLIVMQLVRTGGNGKMGVAANAGACLMLSLAFAMFQAFVPYPLLMSRYADEVFARTWKQVAGVCVDLRQGVWSGRAFSGNVATSEEACDELSGTTRSIPNLLFFAAYEPFERSLYNQLRNERLSLLKRLVVILNATCTSARVFTSMSSSETRAALIEWKRILSEPVDEFLGALAAVMEHLGDSLVPAETVRCVAFEDLQDKKNKLLKSLQACRRFVAATEAAETDAPAFYSFLYFHLLLALQADELHTFAEHLEAFDEHNYKSTWRRFWEFFFIDFWNDFTQHLLGRLLLRTTADVRNFKDGIRLACAYLVAAAFTMKLNSEDSADTYFFGMSIILGMGLPTVAESIEIGVHRITGMAYALVIGYIAQWKTSNKVQAIAVVVCGCFIALCFRDNVRYMHVAWYASFIAPAAYGIAHDRVTMISRVVDNCFSVMSYFIICTMMFPINPYRVLWNKRAVAEKMMASTITVLATIDGVGDIQIPVDVVRARLAVASDNLRVINDMVNQSQQTALICAKEPSLVGNPFPTEQVQKMQLLLQHMCASLEIWVFGLQLLHRQRSRPPHPLIVKMLHALRPLLMDLEVASRVVFQDLIDAVNRPMDWSIDLSVRRLSDFVLIKGRMDGIFYELHKDMILTQNRALRRNMVFMDDCGDPQEAVSRSVIEQCPANVQVPPGYSDGHVLMEEIPVPSEQRARGRGNLPSLINGGDATVPASPSTAADRQVFNLSFRAPAGNLPIDVDVTAFIIIICSVSALTSSLEQMVPYMSAVNKFVKSRKAHPFTIQDFFLCKT